MSAERHPSSAWAQAEKDGELPIEMWAERPETVSLKQLVAREDVLRAWFEDIDRVTAYVRDTEKNAESYRASLDGNIDRLVRAAAAHQAARLSEEPVDAAGRFIQAMTEKIAFSVQTTNNNDWCAHEHNVVSLVSEPLGLNKPLFDVRREGTSFSGATAVDLSLAEIDPPLARDIEILNARIAEERRKLLANAAMTHRHTRWGRPRRRGSRCRTSPRCRGHSTRAAIRGYQGTRQRRRESRSHLINLLRPPSRRSGSLKILEDSSGPRPRLGGLATAVG